MPSHLITRRNALVLAAASCATGPLLHAQTKGASSSGDYPNHPVRLIVPFSAGGTSDVLARALGASLGKLLNQSIIVENRPGANGNLGSDAVAKAAPDGYSLLLAADGTMAINPALYPNLSFKPERDFIAISRVAVVPLLIVASASLKANTLQEVVALSKTGNTSLDYSSAGIGSAGHLTAELLIARTGARMTHVPYKGGGQAITDVVSGQVPLMVTAYATAGPFIQSRKLKAIAVTSAQRLPNLPDVPTVQESGVPDFDAASWYGLMAPARTPEPIIARLHAALAQAMSGDELKTRFNHFGAVPVLDTPAKFEALLRSDITRWAQVVKTNNITLN